MHRFYVNPIHIKKGFEAKLFQDKKINYYRVKHDFFESEKQMGVKVSHNTPKYWKLITS